MIRLKTKCDQCGRVQYRDVNVDRDFMSSYHRQLEKHLQSGSLLVAADVKDDDEIFGWALYDQVDAKLSYVYVKQNYRRMGIATALVEELVKEANRVTYPFLTRIGSRFLLYIEDNRLPGVTFAHVP